MFLQPLFAFYKKLPDNQYPNLHKVMYEIKMNYLRDVFPECKVVLIAGFIS